MTSFDPTFTRRSLRPDPRSPWQSLVDQAGEAVMPALVAVILVGGFLLKACAP